MNLVKTIDQYDDTNVFFCEPIKNNIMNEGNFIRIIYSNSLFVLNGMNLLVPLNNIVVEKYYNKYKCSFQVGNNKEIIDVLKTIEENLLKKVQIKNKMPQYKIQEQMKNGYIKLFLENPEYMNSGQTFFMLKISGIWETENHYGLTYKFLQTVSPF
jgi:uncharacterized protein (DUF2252 family)